MKPVIVFGSIVCAMVSRWEQEFGELSLNSEEFITFTFSQILLVIGKAMNPVSSYRLNGMTDWTLTMGDNQSMGTTLNSELGHLKLYKDGWTQGADTTFVKQKPDKYQQI